MGQIATMAKGTAEMGDQSYLTDTANILKWV